MSFLVNTVCLLFPIFCFDLQFLHASINYPIISAAAYLFLIAGLTFASSNFRFKKTSQSLRSNKLISAAAIFTSLVCIPLYIYLYFDLTVAIGDIGNTTIQAAKKLFIERQNPYSDKSQVFLGYDLNYYGFKYGPLTIFAYGLTAFLGDYSLKFISIFYVLVASILTCMIVFNSKNSISTNLTRILICLSIIFSSRIFWYELFYQGVIDIWQILLLLACFLSLKKQSLFLAGLFLGLSLSSKYAPGIFFLVAFGKLLFNKNLLIGLIVGLTPLIPFLIWDANALINNYIIFHSIKNPDYSSLYMLVDSNHWWMFSLFQIVTIVSTFFISYFRTTNVFKIILSGTILACCYQISNKEIHQNHILWFIPFAAIICCQPFIKTSKGLQPV